MNAGLDTRPSSTWCGAGSVLGPDFGEILTPPTRISISDFLKIIDKGFCQGRDLSIVSQWRRVNMALDSSVHIGQLLSFRIMLTWVFCFLSLETLFFYVKKNCRHSIKGVRKRKGYHIKCRYIGFQLARRPSNVCFFLIYRFLILELALPRAQTQLMLIAIKSAPCV